jgi:hypothetical protein
MKSNFHCERSEANGKNANGKNANGKNINIY